MAVSPRRLVRRPQHDTAALATLDPLLARIYAARGVRAATEVDYSLQRLDDPWMLKGMEAAVERLTTAVERGERITIIGDYDADGATSTALAIRGLRALGFARPGYLIPNRFDFGYGLSPEIVDVAASGKPDLIITVDNGIASIDGVRRAREHGIDVIVTDHHLPGDELPPAVAIVNPNQPGDDFPGKALAGVGVMFHLLIALRQRLRAQGWFERQGMAEPNLAALLDLVALGTVADVVPLDRLNRILVEQGLKRIRAGQCCPGIVALLRTAGKDPATARASDMGFIVGPRLNAAGRLEEMSLGIECLLTDDPARAMEYAAELDQLNRQRRQIEAEMQQQAETICDALQLETAELPWGVALHHDDWHQGVVGLVASRIKERYHRPVIAFASSDRETLKGSARSIPGLHMRDALERVDSRHPGMIAKFGGHAMAAGLTLPRSHFDRFCSTFDAVVREMLPEDALNPVVISDGELQADALHLDTATLLQDAGPWGQSFPEPVFDGRFRIESRRILKERHIKYTLTPTGTRKAVEAIVFNVDPAEWPENGTLHIAYTLDINRFQGMMSLQLMIVAQVAEE